MASIIVRGWDPNDIVEMCEILNKIIWIGGSTAYQSQFEDREFAKHFLEGEGSLCCFVAVDSDEMIAGFQTLHRHSELPDDWVDIATFARVVPKIAGVGTALFAQTRSFAVEAGFAAINAAIRADNRSGLAYYEKMGFETYAVKKSVPLTDGSLVDRIFKKYACSSR